MRSYSRNANKAEELNGCPDKTNDAQKPGSEGRRRSSYDWQNKINKKARLVKRSDGLTGGCSYSKDPSKNSRSRLHDEGRIYSGINQWNCATTVFSRLHDEVEEEGMCAVLVFGCVLRCDRVLRILRKLLATSQLLSVPKLVLALGF